jgi:hypothetical protein
MSFKGIVAGWGALEEGVPNFGVKLQEVKIKVKPNEQCRADLRQIAAFNEESMICGYEANKDACQVSLVQPSSSRCSLVLDGSMVS